MKKPRDGSENRPQIGVMESHDRGDSIELPESLDVLDALQDQTLVGRCLRVDPQSVVAKFCQTFDEPPVTAAEVEDPGTRGNRTRHDSVEGSAPPVVSHRPEGSGRWQNYGAACRPAALACGAPGRPQADPPPGGSDTEGAEPHLDSTREMRSPV